MDVCEFRQAGSGKSHTNKCTEQRGHASIHYGKFFGFFFLELSCKHTEQKMWGSVSVLSGHGTATWSKIHLTELQPIQKKTSRRLLWICCLCFFFGEGGEIKATTSGARAHHQDVEDTELASRCFVLCLQAASLWPKMKQRQCEVKKWNRKNRS